MLLFSACTSATPQAEILSRQSFCADTESTRWWTWSPSTRATDGHFGRFHNAEHRYSALKGATRDEVAAREARFSPFARYSREVKYLLERLQALDLELGTRSQTTA